MSGEWEEKYKRARADYVNLERRVKDQQEEFSQFANSVLILKLLPILDDLEKAVGVAKDDGLPAGRQGLKLVLKNLQGVLKSEGIEEIKIKKGDDFDPTIMECTVAEGSGEKQKVLEVIRKGYKVKDKILRPAQVQVGGKDA